MKKIVLLCLLLACSGFKEVQAAIVYNGPYLGPMTHQSVWICWISNSPTSSNQVEYGLTASYGNTVTGVAGVPIYDGLYRNEVKLTGLAADTEYHYRVMCDGETTQDYTLKTFPSPGATNVRFIVMGDAQWGYSESHGQDFPAIDMLTYVKEFEDTPLAIQAGDLVNNGLAVPNEWNEWFELVNPIMHSIWIAPTLGNHEVYGVSEGELRYPGQYLQTFKIPENADNPDHKGFYYSFDLGFVHFVSLKTNAEPVLADGGDLRAYYNPPGEEDIFRHTEAATQMMDWFTQDVSDARERGMKWVIVYGHNAMYSSGGWTAHATAELCSTTQGTGMREALEEAGVDLYFSGHSHMYLRYLPVYNTVLDSSDNAIRYFVSGAITTKAYPATLSSDETQIGTCVFKKGSYTYQNKPYDPWLEEAQRYYYDWIPMAKNAAGNELWYRAAAAENYNPDQRVCYILVEINGNRCKTTMKYINRTDRKVYVYDVDEWVNSDVAIDTPALPGNLRLLQRN